MPPLVWAILLFVCGIVLLIAEVFLPTHGAVGVLGLLSLLGSAGVCFWISPWLGVGVLALYALGSPFVGALLVKTWPKTYVGRRLVLQPTPGRLEPPTVRPGQEGMTVSELRPIGMGEFDGQRVEVISERGMIAAGRKIKVVHLAAGRPTVREV